jgi:hypothetical protein
LACVCSAIVEDPDAALVLVEVPEHETAIDAEAEACLFL